MMALDDALGMAVTQIAAEIAISKAMDVIEEEDEEGPVSREQVIQQAIRDEDHRKLVQELSRDEQEELYYALEEAAVMNRGSAAN